MLGVAFSGLSLGCRINRPALAVQPQTTLKSGNPAGDQFVRFGAKQFSREDLFGLQATTKTAPVLEAFRHRFPVGSYVLTAPNKEAPVTLCKVLANKGNSFTVDLEDEGATATIGLDKDLFLFQETLAVNLPLVNNRAMAPEAQWRSLFEKHVDRAQSALEARKGHAIPLKQVPNPDVIAHPLGFNIFGQLYMMVNPTFRADELSPIPTLTGYISDPLGMAEVVLPSDEIAEAKAGSPEDNPEGRLKSLVNEFTYIVNPQQLVPIIGEGLYERAAFMMTPSKAQ